MLRIERRNKTVGKFCSYKCFEKHNPKNTKRFSLTCTNCGISFERTSGQMKKSKNFFCSCRCSVKFNSGNKKHTKETKNKISISSLIKNCDLCECGRNKLKTKNHCYRCTSNPINLIKKGICKHCNNNFLQKKTEQTCSEKCRSILKQQGAKIGGQKSVKVQSTTRRSKNEVAFFNLCQTKFNNTLNNVQMFNGWDADIILPDFKIAILWNGKWHYEKITQKHSVKQVQNRDKIKIKEIKNFGYEPYIIKDMGKFSKKFVQSEFEKFILFLKIKHCELV